MSRAETGQTPHGRLEVEVTLVSRAGDSTLDTPGREEHLMP